MIKYLLLFVLSLTSVFAQEYQDLNTAREELFKVPLWKYPYPQLAEKLKAENRLSFPIFSYGSLMDVSSASKTLSEKSIKTRRPAIAFGIRRLFDLDVPIKAGSKWCIPNNPQARGMLNIVKTDSQDDFVNGVLMDIAISDIQNLLNREEGYDLIPVVIQEWNRENAPYQIAYTLQAPIGKGLTSTDILPRPRYYELCRDAIAKFDPLFLMLWFKTTYFADGKTPIIKWEIEIQKLNPDTQANCTKTN